MHRPFETVRSLARPRGARVAAGAAVALGLAAGGLPLLDAAGYELGQLSALLAAVLAPWLGISAARRALATPAPSPLAAFGAAALAGAVLVGLFAAGVLVRAALGPCRVFVAGGFLPALAAPSLLLGSAVAVAVTFAARGRPGRAAALHALVVLGSLAFTLRHAYLGPAAHAFDPFLGYWPGPLYDELLPLDPRVLRRAAGTTGWAVLVVAWTAALAGRRAGARRAPLGALALATAALAVLGARLDASPGRGPDAARTEVARALGGRLEGARCTLHFPAEKPEAAARELHRACEFHVADVARALAVDAPRVTVFVYRSAEEKRRLVGAAHTDYTKPWLAEIHLGDQPLPHPVLRHEVVHAVASAAADGPLAIPAAAGIVPAMALVEGLAVALETPRSAWTVHEWSRAARDQGWLPDLARILGPAGFWAQAPARAYTAAGSFLAFVLERHGPAAVRAAYGSGDLAAATGRPLPALVAEWQAFLDGVPVPEGLAPAARARLARPSLFARRCVREQAAVEAAAGAAAAGGRLAEACALYDRVAALGGGAGLEKARADALARAGDLRAAEGAYRLAAARAAEEGGALAGAVAAAEGDLAWRAGDVARARARWAEALAARPDRGEARLLLAKAGAAGEPALGPAARAYLLGLSDPSTALARVARVDHPLAAYLVGKQLAARGEHAAAAPELEAAARGGLPPPLEREARLVAGEAWCAAGEVERGAALLDALGAADGAAADRARVEAALRRCAFERAVRLARPG